MREYIDKCNPDDNLEPGQVALACYKLNADRADVLKDDLLLHAFFDSAKRILKGKGPHPTGQLTLELEGGGVYTFAEYLPCMTHDGVKVFKRSDHAKWATVQSFGDISAQKRKRVEIADDANQEAIQRVKPVMEPHPDVTLPQALEVLEIMELDKSLTVPKAVKILKARKAKK